MKNLIKDPVFLVVAGVVVIGVGYYAVKTVSDAAAGVVSGNNAVTENQTNAEGEKTTAYEGAGVIGTVGAVFNSASGGRFATWGEGIGEWAFGVFGPRTVINPDPKSPR